MAKVMVSLPDDLLRAVDSEAQLAEESLRRRTVHRAARMAEIDSPDEPVKGHGGGVAKLVKASRPGR